MLEGDLEQFDFDFGRAVSGRYGVLHTYATSKALLRAWSGAMARREEREEREYFFDSHMSAEFLSLLFVSQENTSDKHISGIPGRRSSERARFVVVEPGVVNTRMTSACADLFSPPSLQRVNRSVVGKVCWALAKVSGVHEHWGPDILTSILLTSSTSQKVS